MEQLFCGNCGSDLPSDSVFCSNCGTSLQQQANKQQLNVQQPSVPFFKRYKWLIVGLAAAAIIFTIFQLQNDKPEKVATDFVTHISNADLDKAYDLIAVHADEYFQDDFREMMEYYRLNKREARREILGNMDFKSFSVNDAEVYGDEFVSITGEIVYGDGDTEQVYIDLLKENGKWKVEDAN